VCVCVCVCVCVPCVCVCQLQPLLNFNFWSVCGQMDGQTLRDAGYFCRHSVAGCIRFCLEKRLSPRTQEHIPETSVNVCLKLCQTRPALAHTPLPAVAGSTTGKTVSGAMKLFPLGPRKAVDTSGRYTVYCVAV
jgi:hypothetical protein